MGPGTDADAPKPDARFLIVMLIGGMMMAGVVWAGSAQLGPLPRDKDPVYVAFAGGDEVATDDEALRRSLEHEREGNLQAAARDAETAMHLGGGRDAALQAAKIAILQQRYEAAEAWLRPLVEAGGDDAALYNLALIAHRSGDLEAARSGYHEVLRVNPRHADARYNLAYLHWQRGADEQALQQAGRFAVDFPNDPRSKQLSALVRTPR